MKNNSDCQAFIEHLRMEHRRLHEVLAQVQRTFETTVGTGESLAATFLMLGGQLQTLRNELERHFAEEEHEGCMDEVVMRCPSTAPNVKAICHEHVGLLKELDGLVARVAAAAPVAEFHAVQREFHDFVKKLREHEAKENRVIQYGFGSDAMDLGDDEHVV